MLARPPKLPASIRRVERGRKSVWEYTLVCLDTKKGNARTSNTHNPQVHHTNGRQEAGSAVPHSTLPLIVRPRTFAESKISNIPTRKVTGKSWSSDFPCSRLALSCPKLSHSHTSIHNSYRSQSAGRYGVTRLVQPVVIVKKRSAPRLVIRVIGHMFAYATRLYLSIDF